MTRKNESDPIKQPKDYFPDDDADDSDAEERSLRVLDEFSLAMQTYVTRRGAGEVVN